MSRNKYPEETVQLILDVALKLFIEKGYDETSIQDIINNLGGLSKGAIYHHFKSKESILIAVYQRLSDQIEKVMTAILEDNKLNGMQKLQKMFASSLQGEEHLELFSAAPNLLDNPRLLAIQIKSTVQEVVPRYIEPVIEEGQKDGSIKTEYPKEVAEVMILISNLWLNPLVYKMKPQEVRNKIKFFTYMMNSMGIPMMNEEMEVRLLNLVKLTERE